MENCIKQTFITLLATETRKNIFLIKLQDLTKNNSKF